MARDYGPFPSKPMYEVVNRRMQRALAEAMRSTGFTKTGQGAVSAGTGAQLVIAAYPDGALVDGLYVENPVPETVTLTANTASTNPRIDRLVMRLDMAAETIAPFQIIGTPAASPQVPPLVQTATVFDMPLVRFTMPGSASAQNPGSIVNEWVSSTTSVSATGRVPVTVTSLVDHNLGLTPVITLPAIPAPSRVVFTALGRSGFRPNTRQVAWDWDSTPASATNVVKDDPNDKTFAPAGHFVTVASTLTMDLPANVAPTFRLVVRSDGDVYNNGSVVWVRGPVT